MSTPLGIIFACRNDVDEQGLISILTAYQFSDASLQNAPLQIEKALTADDVWDTLWPQFDCLLSKRCTPPHSGHAEMVLTDAQRR